MSNFIEEKSFSFAVRIVKLYCYLCSEKKEYVLSKQVLKSGTSIGANICEAQEAQSKADFIAKLNIALKESAETEYWLKLLAATGFIYGNSNNSLLDDCIELKKLLVSIIKSTKSN